MYLAFPLNAAVAVLNGGMVVGALSAVLGLVLGLFPEGVTFSNQLVARYFLNVKELGLFLMLCGLGVVVAGIVPSVILRIAVWCLQRTKPRGDNAPKIAVFRRFDQRVAVHVRLELAPTLGCFGTVHLVADKTFVAADPAMRDSITSWVDKGGFEVDQLGDVDIAITIVEDDWIPKVAEIIADCDIAVFDATSAAASTNVQWELRRCLAQLGVERVFVIGAERGEIDDLIRTLGEDRDNGQGISSFVYGRASARHLRAAVLSFMRRLSRSLDP